MRQRLCFAALYLLLSMIPTSPAIAQQENGTPEDGVEEPPLRRPSSAPT